MLSVIDVKFFCDTLKKNRIRQVLVCPNNSNLHENNCKTCIVQNLKWLNGWWS